MEYVPSIVCLASTAVLFFFEKDGWGWMLLFAILFPLLKEDKINGKW